jgi:hypothetical protein
MYQEYLDAIFDGDSNKVKYLYEYFKKNGNLNLIHGLNDNSFMISCREGYLEIAQFLWEISQNTSKPINLHNLNCKAFRSSCINKNIHIVKWLIELSEKNNQPFNFHKIFVTGAIVEESFELKLLLETFNELGINVNIRNNNDEAFKKCCELGNIDVANFLCDLYSGYKIEYNLYNGDIEYFIFENDILVNKNDNIII